MTAKRSPLILLLALAGLPNCAFSQPIPPGAALVTAFTPGAPRNNFTAGYGMQFTLGNTPLFVTALGRIDIAGNTGTHVVKLVRASDGTDVPGGSVTVSLASNGTAGQFVYTPLANPVTLDANASYYLITQETNGGDLFYDAGPVTAASVVTVNSGVVFWPGVGFIPIGRANFSFGPVNLLYSTTPVTPPSVSIAAPAAGATISGNGATVTATATAAAGLTIGSVQFQVDSANVGAPVTSAPYSIALDTTKLTNGPHVLTAVATDSANTPGLSAPVNVTVNNTATTVSIATPAAGATVSGSLTVSASAIPGSGLTITSVQFKLDNAGVGAPVTVGPYSLALDTTKLSNGPHTLVAVATDSANNTVTSTPPTGITVNNTATTVAIAAPAAGAMVSGSLTVSAAAVPGSGLTITGVQFKLDTANVGALGTTNPYSIVLDTTTLSNGPHTLVAVAMDSSNASVTSMPPVNITVNNSGPPVSGTALVTVFTPGTARNNFTGSVGMQFTVGATPLFVTALGRIDIAGNAGIHVVKLVRASDGTDVPGGAATVSLPAGGSAGQFVYAPLPSPVALAANTAYYLLSLETGGGDQFYDAGPVTATSAVTVNSAVVFWPGVGFQSVGRPNFSFGPVNLIYGTTPVTPPSVSITVPAAGATISGNNATVTATASAAAGLTIGSVQFQVDNANVGAPVASAPYSIALDTTKLTNGPHALTAVATDSANTPGISAPVNVTVNNAATTVAITVPAAGAAVSGSLTVAATATPANGLTIASVQFKLDNANVGAPVTASPYTIALDTTKLSNGPHTLIAVATDSANTPVASAPVGFTVNNTATTVAITAPASGATVSGNLTISATAVPGTGLTIAGVQFKVDNANVGAPVTSGPYNIVLDTTTLANGPHALVAMAMDSSNASVTSMTINITVNNSGPPPAGTALVTGFTPGKARQDFTGGFGMQFTVGATPLNVTALGRIYIAGNTGMHVVKLARVSDGTDVPGGSVTISLPPGTPAGQFVYVGLPAPVTLDANAAYYLFSQEINGGDQFYDAAPVTTTAAVSVTSAVVYSPDLGVFKKVGPSNYSSGPVNLLYTTGP